MLVYLVSSLAGLLVPLFWACFFAVPLTALIARIDRSLTSLLSQLRWKLEGVEQPKGPEKALEFTAKAGENQIMLSKDDAKSLMQKLEHPTPPEWLEHQGCPLFPHSQCCQSRVRIVKLTTEDGQPISDPEVDRLVANWLYYVKHPDDAALDDDEVPLQLFLDSDCSQYPAVFTTNSGGTSLKGALELDRTSIMSWSVSVFLAMMVLGFGMFIFFFTVSLGVDALQDNSANYSKGVEDLIQWFSAMMSNFMPHDQIVQMKGHMESTASKMLPSLSYAAGSKIESLGFDLLLFTLYVLFWVFEPIPISNNVAQVIKDYLLLKTVACFIYAVLMSAMLYFLDCPVWHLFFVASFLLNYIPEFGFIVVFILVIPAVAFNSKLSMQQREADTAFAIVGSILIKILVANILEVKMYVSKGGQYMRMHPVVLMGLMMFFEKFFGLTGMFLAIPMVATVKYYLLSADIPNIYLNPTLAILEGDDTAPHKNFIDRKADFVHTTYGSTEPPEAKSDV